MTSNVSRETFSLKNDQKNELLQKLMFHVKHYID